MHRFDRFLGTWTVTENTLGAVGAASHETLVLSAEFRTGGPFERHAVTMVRF